MKENELKRAMDLLHSYVDEHMGSIRYCQLKLEKYLIEVN